MKSYTRYLSITLLLFTLIHYSSCNTERKRNNNTVQQERWDAYNFKDTLTMLDSAKIDSMIVNTLLELDELSPKEAKDIIENMLENASKNPKALTHFSTNLAYHLYEPNSLLYNEQYYGYILDYLMSHQEIEASEITRYRIIKNNIEKNSPGQLAPDFNFTTTANIKTHLYQPKEGYKLLLFYDPGCQHCFDLIQQLKVSSILNDFIDQKKVTVITITPFDTQELWKDYHPFLSPKWINGINDDQSIFVKQLYHFRAYPTLYLINNQNIIILKDPSLREALNYLQKH